MSYNLFIDDKISPYMAGYGDREFVIVRSHQSCIDYIKNNGLPDFISFDYDLGVDGEGKPLPTGEDVLKWLVFDGKYNLTHLKFAVHVSGKEGERLLKLLKNYVIEYLQRIDRTTSFSCAFMPYWPTSMIMETWHSTGGTFELRRKSLYNSVKPVDLSGDIFSEDF